MTNSPEVTITWSVISGSFQLSGNNYMSRIDPATGNEVIRTHGSRGLIGHSSRPR